MKSIYRVTIRTHYGTDLHEYSHEAVDFKQLQLLQEKYPHKICRGHTYDTPNDDIVKIEKLK